MKKILFFFLLGLVTRQGAFAQDTSYTVHYALSPLDSVKPYREKTVAIVLHTMEGYLRGGLKGMVDSALCNYAIGYSGQITCIVDKYKVSNHAGRSMWNGDTMFSRFSIGIEFEGFSLVHPTKGQLSPQVAKFIYDLQVEFGIPDSMVLIHPMVACYYPWSRDNPHPGFYARGRKRDAFYFAEPSVRSHLGLGPIATIDPDARDGNMVQYKPLVKRFGMHYFTEEEITERRRYLERKQDSLLASMVQPIVPCAADCFPVDEATIVEISIATNSFVLEEQKKSKGQIFAILPRRLRVQK